MISRPLFLCCLLLFLGCDPPALRPINEIKGAEFISFRCVDPTPGGEGVAGGGPLENCGCTKVVEVEGEPKLERLGRIQCTCIDANGTKVDYVQPGQCGDDSCEPSIVDGDYVAVEGEEGVRCVPAGGGQIRAYVGSNTEAELSVIEVHSGFSGQHGESDSSRRIPV